MYTSIVHAELSASAVKFRRRHVIDVLTFLKYYTPGSYVFMMISVFFGDASNFYQPTVSVTLTYETRSFSLMT
jgi:hypothetical protein